MTPQVHHRVGRKQRSGREWASRIALACGLAVLGYHSIAFSIAQVAVRSRPQTADKIVGYDGRLIADHAATLLTPDVTPAGRFEAAALSRKALRRDPTTVLAAATLGIVTLSTGDAVEARRLLQYAQALSRRNVQTQLWSIEDAVGHGNILRALHWYDITLRTKPEMSDVLYPVLAQASRDPTIRAALIRTLVGKPSWSDSYVGYAAAQKDDPQNTAALFIGLRDRELSISPPAETAVVNTLLNAGKIDQAWRYYTTIRPGADRFRARDPHFTAMLEAPSAFDWTPLSDNSIAASIQRTRDGGMFEFTAPASVGGPVLQQVQWLPAGTYHLTGHSSGIAQNDRELPYWALICRGDGRELGRVAVPNSERSGGMFVGTLTVPTNCPVQTLTFFVQPSDAISGMLGRISRLSLLPLR